MLVEGGNLGHVCGVFENLQTYCNTVRGSVLCCTLLACSCGFEMHHRAVLQTRPWCLTKGVGCNLMLLPWAACTDLYPSWRTVQCPHRLWLYSIVS